MKVDMRYLSKDELLDELERGITVGEAIKMLENYDKNMILINSRSKDYLPISTIEKTKVDYCFDEVISKEVVSIW